MNQSISLRKSLDTYPSNNVFLHRFEESLSIRTNDRVNPNEFCLAKIQLIFQNRAATKQCTNDVYFQIFSFTCMITRYDT